METDTKFQKGDHVAFENRFGYSYGVVSNVIPGGRYEIKWDDGFVDKWDFYYDEGELLSPAEVEEQFSGTWSDEDDDESDLKICEDCGATCTPSGYCVMCGKYN